MQKKQSAIQLLPVLFSFFIMGFCDLVGISVTYAQAQFNWTETQAGFLPSLVFLWFFILSIPAAMAMDVYGRKKMVLSGLFFTLLATLIPVVVFTETTCYITFILLGIGNTILQVAVNPLLTNIISGKQLASYVTLGQFIKAISSFIGPILVGFFSLRYGSWEKSFYIYTALTSLSLLWLFFTRIEEGVTEKKTASFTKTIGLLNNKNILLAFIGILCIVGIDVGMNTVTPKLLIERVGLAKEAATYGSSWYFAARTIGTICGVFLLSKFSVKYFFRVNMFIVMLSLVGLLFANEKALILFLVCIIAFTSSSIFAVIYTLALRSKPLLTNEISGLMITGVAGGAIIPPLMGLATDMARSQQGAVGIILLCGAYLLYCSFKLGVSTQDA
ncbi:sugar MFS transporter [Flavobacterium sp. NRK1]|uniref:MFS transporter n=1 Tax=Flavobacterium sp. NRK1 TaxID=2954929 RepID=UPI0020935242|nr:MFS transporter [Flavobacterium sp. NRK1]MCO6149667.1 MFS transporter [Flavobacterium sp. NRK1]